MTPWAELERTIAPFYPSSGGRGRPPIGLARMLRMYVAQQCFGLSDEGVEDALYDSHAIRRFVGIVLAREAAPGATTLLKFGRLLEKHQLTESIFNTINAHLAEKGLLLPKAYPTRSPSRRPTSQTARVHCLLSVVARLIYKPCSASWPMVDMSVSHLPRPSGN